MKNKLQFFKDYVQIEDSNRGIALLFEVYNLAELSQPIIFVDCCNFDCLFDVNSQYSLFIIGMEESYKAVYVILEVWIDTDEAAFFWFLQEKSISSDRNNLWICGKLCLYESVLDIDGIFNTFQLAKGLYKKMNT